MKTEKEITKEMENIVYALLGQDTLLGASRLQGQYAALNWVLDMQEDVNVPEGSSK